MVIKKKIDSSIFQFGIILVFLFLSKIAAATELVFYNWENYISSSVIEQFETETGHSIKVLIFDRDKDRDELIASKSSEGIDLAVIETVATKLFGKNNLLQPMGNITPNPLKNTDPRWAQSCGDFGVPYLWGTLGIVYRNDKVHSAPKSWGDLVYPNKEAQGHISMQLDSIDTFVPALKVLGLSINAENTADLKKAYNILLEQKKSVSTYEYVVSYSHKNRDDDIYMALVYSGDQLTLNANLPHDPWTFVVPVEGTSIWVDCLTVLSSSKKQKAAAQFIEFMSRPQIAASNSADLRVATPNYLAKQYLSKEFLEDGTIFPSQKTQLKSEFYKILSNRSIRLRNRIINQLEKN
ncbi:MAG: spermidine/putrescine ABC transporter substrate-binding protein [Oceanospirillaceae bacterium]